MMASETLRAVATATDDPGTRSDLDATWKRCRMSFYRFFSVRAGGDEHLVDDLMQQLWLRASVADDRRRAADAEPWLWTIAQNLLRERGRREGKLVVKLRANPDLVRQIVREFDSAPAPLELLMQREVQQQLLLALTHLGSADQELLIGRYFEHRSHVELARGLGISERAVEGRLFRARAQLRQELVNLGSEE